MRLLQLFRQDVFQLCAGSQRGHGKTEEGKEVIDTYFIVKVTKVFDDVKEPEGIPMEGIIYERYDAAIE